jgi:hypothetical protein
LERGSKKLTGAFGWHARWGADLRSKLTYAEDDAKVIASKRKEVETWCDANGVTGDERARRLAEFDASPAGTFVVQPCFQEPEYELFRRYWRPPSLEGTLWEMYRRLAGHRTMTIIPMGGAIPGAIPVLVAYEYLERKDFEEEEWDLALEIWEMMDSIAAEQRNKEAAKSG